MKMPYRKSCSSRKRSSAPGKRGFYPCFCLPACCNCPVALSEFLTCFTKASKLRIGKFQKVQLQQGKQIAKLNFLRKCGLLAHTSAAFLKNCCTEKLFICLRLVPSSQQYYPLTSQKNRHRNFFRFHDGFLSALSPLLIHIEETEPSRISCKMFIQRRPI